MNTIAKRILADVAIAYGVRVPELIGSSRKSHLTEARAMCVLLLQEYLPGASLSVVGDILSRDHSTILQISRRAIRLVSDNTFFAHLYLTVAKGLTKPSQ